MRYPAFLKRNGTIGFPAPSFGCNIEPYFTAFNHAQEVLREKGHSLLCGPNAYAGDGIGISSTPQRCGEEFTQMYTGTDCDAIISCGGGELMCEILDHVDFEAVKKAEPKWFMGYSDNTNISFLLATLCDVASIYGPCAPTFGMEKWHPAVEDAYRLLRGEKLTMEGYERYETEGLKDEEHPLAPYNCTEPRRIVAFSGDGHNRIAAGVHGSTGADTASAADTASVADTAAQEIRFSGRLIGGCLDILANLCGTGYDQVKAFNERYKEDGFIWFLEACDLTVYGIRRAIWELQHAGWFSHVKGFLIGRPLAGAQELFGLDHIHAVTDLLAEYQVPVLLDVDLGHVPPMMPVIVGSMAQVTYRPAEDDFRLEMKLQ